MGSTISSASVLQKEMRSLKSKNRTQQIFRALQNRVTEVRVELDHRSPFELLVATILSAQCTDERVNQVTPTLFQRYPKVFDLAHANPRELEHIIHPTGFFKNKARNLIACAQKLLHDYQGTVPNSMEDLTRLPGIGRKTANVILGACFGKPAVVVDTHVKRVSQRLKFTTHSDPTKIEDDLQALLPRKEWTQGSQRLLLHGRYVCLARNPKCLQCVLWELCTWEGKTLP